MVEEDDLKEERRCWMMKDAQNSKRWRRLCLQIKYKDLPLERLNNNPCNCLIKYIYFMNRRNAFNQRSISKVYETGLMDYGTEPDRESYPGS